MDFKDIFLLDYATDVELAEIILSEIKNFDNHCDSIIAKNIAPIKSHIYNLKKNQFDVFSCYVISSVEVGLYKSRAELIYINFKDMLYENVTLEDIENHFNGVKQNCFYDNLVVFYAIYRMALDYFSAFQVELNKDLELLLSKQQQYQICVNEINFFKEYIEDQLLIMGLSYIKEKRNFESIDRDNLIFKLDFSKSKNINIEYYFSIITKNENKIYELIQKKGHTKIVHSFTEREIVQGKLNLDKKRFCINTIDNWLTIKTNEIVNIDFYESYLLQTGLDFELNLIKASNNVRA